MSSERASSDHDSPSTADDVDDDLAVWGWHHTMGKGIRITGGIVAVIILTMTIGNHEGHIEDLWLAAIALIMIGALVIDAGKRRKSWR